MQKIRGVVQLVANPAGWTKAQTEYHINRGIYIGGNPEASQNHTPAELLNHLHSAWLTTQSQRPNDWNGLKVYVRELMVRDDGKLITRGVLTDYYTLWGLPKAAPELFREHEASVTINRAGKNGEALYRADLPWGLCSHNMLLDSNGDVYAMIRSRNQAFNEGRLSPTQEEQEEQGEKEDSSAYATSARSFKEELHIYIPQRRIRLLGVAEEPGAAYPAYAFITETGLSPKEIKKRWKKAKDYSENTAMLLIPMSQLDQWISEESITPKLWLPNLISDTGNIQENAIIQFHATGRWRLDLARQYSHLAR